MMMIIMMMVMMIMIMIITSFVLRTKKLRFEIGISFMSLEMRNSLFIYIDIVFKNIIRKRVQI